jgi:hypothetical protein
MGDCAELFRWDQWTHKDPGELDEREGEVTSEAETGDRQP